LKRSTQQKQQEPKAREKPQTLRENHDQMEAIKMAANWSFSKGAVGDRGYACGRLSWFENRGMWTVDCGGMGERDVRALCLGSCSVPPPPHFTLSTPITLLLDDKPMKMKFLIRENVLRLLYPIFSKLTYQITHSLDEKS